jgi:hypothetical protein
MRPTRVGILPTQMMILPATWISPGNNQDFGDAATLAMKNMV